jgi:GTP-binding protein
MFIDHARIHVTAGGGGNGCVSFRREKYVPLGGPDGGDGGDGGDIVLVATSRFNSLNHLRYHRIWKGHRGVHGMGSGCHGKRADDVIIEVPIGTVVKRPNSPEILADLSEDGARFVAARGGSGGRGNPRFASSKNQAPRFAERGEPGEEADIDLELKLIADIGIVGLPNAGKSTLLSRISAARPKIAEYPFTTLSPNLGVADLPGYRTLTVADIPGIIEGAAGGKGLGLDFLRHIERTKVLLILIDGAQDNPAQTVATLERELAEYSDAFAERPRVIAFNKADLPDARESFERRPSSLRDALLVSAVTGEGIDALLEALWSALERARAEELQAAPELSFREHTFEPPFTIEPADDGFAVAGRKVRRIVRMTDFSNDEAVRHLDATLKKMGLFRALRRMGAQDGVTIHIDGVELEYHPE